MTAGEQSSVPQSSNNAAGLQRKRVAADKNDRTHVMACMSGCVE